MAAKKSKNLAILPEGYNPMNMMREFLKLEAASGLILLFFAMVAMVIANSPLSHFYHSLLHETKAVVGLGPIVIEKDLIHWINDGLMAVFFFLVGLEIKREVKEGLLSSKDQILLPVIGAIGGMAVPGIIFFMLNKSSPETMSGWAIPTATDIAFAVGILSLLGRRVPLGLKVFLLALAIIDDLGAIVIIALFYTQELHIVQLYVGAAFLAGLFILNRFKVHKGSLYFMLGIGLWICVLKSGVHATLAGVITAFMIPLTPREGERRSLLRQLEHDLHTFVAYVVLPVFAFANAGVSLEGITLDVAMEPVTLGVILGLFFGKQIGILGTVFLSVKSGLVKMPAGGTWGRLWGISTLAGIGFTMSLFIGTLGYLGKDVYLTQAKLGILSGSILAALFGLGLMWFFCRDYVPKEKDEVEDGAVGAPA